jgi:type I restriction enzyme S subunit
MALKLAIVCKKDIQSNIVKRMDSKFWLIRKDLERFFNVHKSESLDDLKEYYVNGLEFRDFNESFETPYIRVSDMKQPNINLQAIKYVNVKLNEIKEKYKINDKTVLLSRSGNVGIASLPDRYAKQAIISSHIIKIQLKDSVSPFYIVAILNSKIGKLQIFSLTNGQLIKEINRSSLKQIKIPFLDNYNEIEEKMRKVNEKHENSLNLIHQAQQLFYQKLGIDFSRIRKENFYSVNLSDFRDVDLWTPKFSYPLYVNTLKAIKQKWETVKIGKIATVKKGNEVGSENYNSYLDKKDSDIPFIRTSDLVNYEVDQFPDFYIPKEIYEELNQDIQAGDVLFNNDGKIGLVAMLTPQDKVILQSHIRRIRLKKEAIEEYGLTQEYLFLVLTIREIAKYQADMFTVIQSTIPTISNHLLDIEIPILDKHSIDEITKLVKEAFKLKDEKKKLIQEVREEIDKYFEV